MNCFAICKLCSTNSSKMKESTTKKKEKDKEFIDQVDNDSTYGVIDSTTSEIPDNEEKNKKTNSIHSPQSTKTTNVSFRFRAKKVLFGNDRLSQPSILKDNVKENTKSTNRKSLPIFCNKNKRELPKLPVPIVDDEKSNEKNGKRQISFDDKVNEVYESIYPEIDSIVDPFYSKLNEGQGTQKYDYPIFNNKSKKSTGREKNQDDPIYTSASQIYGGSEDAYSSIVSNVGGEKENGYAKMSERKDNDPDNNIPMVDEDLPSTSIANNSVSVNLDALYAKIKRPINKHINRNMELENPRFEDSIPILSNTDNSILPKNDNITSDSLYQQLDESGSGSIVSSHSRNPSYRYITVRETVDVVRERIRNQQEEAFREGNNNNNNNIIPQGREHYYSSINEYESVGDGNISDNIYDINTSYTANYLKKNNEGVRIIRPKIVPSTTYPSIRRMYDNRTVLNKINSRSISMAEIAKNNSNVKTINIKQLGKDYDKTSSSNNNDNNLKKNLSNSYNHSWSSSLDNAITFISEILGEQTPVEDIMDDAINISYDIFSSSIDKMKNISDSMISSRTNYSEIGSQTDCITKIPQRSNRKKSVDVETQTKIVKKVQEETLKKKIEPRLVHPKDYVSTIDLSNERSWPLKK
uniref:cGMP-dependent protein kinase n=1 Tax=Parastrongyloides trichosuri TaxID=131310 RepID=A0A0N4ZZ39_PARTI